MKTSNVPAYRYIRPVAGGLVSILNQNSYVMGTYNPRTGKVSWERLVGANERASIEKNLAVTYPK